MGLNCESSQKRLLTEKDLTLTKAIEIASVMEMAVKDTEELNPQGRREEVKQEVFRTAVKPTATNWKYRPPPSRESACYRCGNTDHDHKVCRFKDQTCHNCGKTGHLKRVCRNNHDCVRLKLKPNAQPKFFKARTVPFALRAGVEAELSRLEEQGRAQRVGITSCTSKESEWGLTHLWRFPHGTELPTGDRPVSSTQSR